jgi:ribosomal protein S18 acetylase RimI-like enzyme
MTHTTARDQDAATLRPRKASRDSIPILAETLALSFYDDPVVTWCVPDDMRRRELLPDFFTAIVESYLNYDEIYDVPAGVSAAVWAPPGAEDDEKLPERIGEILQENADRAFVALSLMAEVHPTDAHHYLFFVGTRPGWQGRGIGSAVMSPVLETCDNDVAPAYLEATSEGNKALYLRHGFEVMSELNLPDGPPMWPMWRTPQAVEA